MIDFIAFLLYLAFGFVSVGFFLSRDKYSNNTNVLDYIVLSLIWPFSVGMFGYSYAKDAGFRSVIPYLRKVFGGPRRG